MLEKYIFEIINDTYIYDIHLYWKKLYDYYEKKYLLKVFIKKYFKISNVEVRFEYKSQLIMQ